MNNRALNSSIQKSWLMLRLGTDTRLASPKIAKLHNTSVARVYGNLSYLSTSGQITLLTKQPGYTVIL